MWKASSSSLSVMMCAGSSALLASGALLNDDEEVVETAAKGLEEPAGCPVIDGRPELLVEGADAYP